MASINGVYIRWLKKEEGQDNKILYSGDIYHSRNLLGSFKEVDDERGIIFDFDSPGKEKTFKEKSSEYFEMIGTEPPYEPWLYVIDRLIELISAQKYFSREIKRGYGGIGVTADGRAISIPKSRSGKSIKREFPEVTELYFSLSDFDIEPERKES